MTRWIENKMDWRRDGSAVNSQVAIVVIYITLNCYPEHLAFIDERFVFCNEKVSAY